MRAHNRRSIFGAGVRAGLLLLAVTLLTNCGSIHDLGNMGTTSVFDELTSADLSVPKGGNVSAGPQGANVEPVQFTSAIAKIYGNTEPEIRIIDRAVKSDGGQGYELNFNDTSLPDLVKVILHDTLKVSYIYDPRVQGKVTISSGRALTKKQLISLLESILQMHQGALIVKGSQYNIIPAARAERSTAPNISYVEEANEIGPGYGLSVFPLRYISSASMSRMLKSFTAKANTVRAHIHSNILVVRGTGRERKSLIRLAETFDVDWMRGQSIGIYALSQAMPEDVIRELNDIFKTKRGGFGNGLVRLRPIERLNAVMVISEQANLLDQVEEWVRRLDRRNAGAVNSYGYNVENAKAKHMAALLNETFSGTSRSAVRRATDQISPDDRPREIRSGGSTDKSGSFPLSAIDENLSSGNATNGNRPGNFDRPTSSSRINEFRVVADEVNNKLIIFADGATYRQVLAVLRRLDRQPVQVLINATLAEVTLNDNLRFGVQLFLKKNADQITQHLTGFSNGNSLVIQPALPGLNYLFGLGSSPKVILDALANETSVKVVSSPSVVVVNNKSARLQVGDEVPISTRQSTSVTDPEAPIVNSIEFRDTGVILDVVPRVNSSGMVTMEITQEISSVKATTAVGDNGAGTLTPTISKRKISSTISVRSGQMVVLGGLISETRETLKNSVPVWEKIPLIGNIPGRKTSGLIRTELVIFLRPIVIRNDEDASLLAQEFRARLESLTPDIYRKYDRSERNSDRNRRASNTNWVVEEGSVK